MGAATLLPWVLYAAVVPGAIAAGIVVAARRLGHRGLAPVGVVAGLAVGAAGLEGWPRSWPGSPPGPALVLALFGLPLVAAIRGRLAGAVARGAWALGAWALLWTPLRGAFDSFLQGIPILLAAASTWGVSESWARLDARMGPRATAGFLVGGALAGVGLLIFGGSLRLAELGVPAIAVALATVGPGTAFASRHLREPARSAPLLLLALALVVDAGRVYAELPLACAVLWLAAWLAPPACRRWDRSPVVGWGAGGLLWLMALAWALESYG